MALKPRENKVKFGLKRVAFALATIAADGSAVYGDPVSFPGARSLSLEPQGVGEAWHADDGVYYFSSAPESRQGDLEMARMIDAFKRQVLGYVIDANGVDAEDINPPEVHFALLFETMNDKKPRRYVMYNCVATAPIVGSTTNEGGKEVQSETSAITSMGVYVASHDKWVDCAETTPRTDPEAYANWFTAVQLPAPPADPYPIKTKSGSVVVISDGAEDMAVTSLVIDIASTAGVTGATITRNRKNLLPSLSNPVTQNGITATPEQNGTITVSGTATSNTEIHIATIDRKPNVDYTVSGCPANGSTSTYRLMIRLYNGGASLQTISDVGDGRTIPATLQPTANQIKVSIWIANGQAIDHMEFKPMVEIGSAVTGFEPYQGNTYDLTFPSGAGTVTAGTLDVTNGVLTVGSQTYGMTPVEITTLHGDNIIFADCGDVTVQYHSDPDLDFE